MKNRKLRKLLTVLTVICALITVISLFFDILLSLYAWGKFNAYIKDSNTIGITGGADGPTAIILAGKFTSWWISVVFAMFTVLGIIFLVSTKDNANGNEH